MLNLSFLFEAMSRGALSSEVTLRRPRALFTPPSEFSAAAAAVCTFYFIPMGSLPSYIEAPFGIIFFIFLFMLSAFLSGIAKGGMKAGAAELRRSFSFTGALSLSLLVTGLLLHRLGFGGSFFALDAFASASVYRAVSPLFGLGILVCFSGCGMALALSAEEPQKQPPAAFSLRLLSGAAVLCALYGPPVPARFFGLTGFWLYLLDLLCSWFYLFSLGFAVLRLRRWSQYRRPLFFWLTVALLLFGAVLASVGASG